MKTLMLLALLGPEPRDRAQDFYDRIQFERPSPDSDEGRKVVETLLKKEHWLAAYKAIENLLGPMSDDYALSVDFSLEGKEAGWGGGTADSGRIRFNLKLLTEVQKSTDALYEQIREAEGRGKTVTFKVPPVRIPRLVYHELTHIFQRGNAAPAWFMEGMAQLVSDDPSNIAAFLNEGKKVKSIEEVGADRNDAYARGHLFWKWLDSRGVARKVANISIIQRKSWRDALEEATGSPWAVLVLTEREWSAKEAERLQSGDSKSR